jgi:ATP-binding protein involved in chromosome partitioning
VGKSTVALNLALALQNTGLKVGLLDTDIYGPSLPRMVGQTDAKPNVNHAQKIEPVTAYGLVTMSMGYLVDEKSAVVWRGPMLFKAMDQFLRQVEWGDLDILVIDLPPGTGDVQLSLVQKVPVAGAVIVSTPQDVALMDVKKCIDMFARVKVPILGLIENMSTFSCPHCHESTELFPQGELKEFCKALNIPILAKIPFTPKMAVAGDSGEPYFVNDTSTPAAHALFEAAKNLKF